jgi:hypothetical protein
MTSVPGWVLGYIRNTVGNFMSDTCIIKAKSDGKSATYAPNDQYVTLQTDVPCRVLPVASGSTSNDAVFGSRQTVEETYQFSLPYGTTVAAGYLITVNDEDYRVVNILQQHTDKTDVQLIATKQ